MKTERNMLSLPQAQRLIQVALGREPADLVLKNACCLNVFTDSWETGDLAIVHGQVAGMGVYHGKTEWDMTGRKVVPGFIDGHIHLESSLVTPQAFAQAVVPHGTSAVVTDPHEIANVLGSDGIEYMMQATDGLPLDVWFMAPSCVPATPEDEGGATLTAADVEPWLSHPRVLGLAEMMNYPGVLNGDPDVLQKILAAKQAGKQIDGHAPGLAARQLNAYVAGGIVSDHECSTFEEAVEKLSRGQWIMIREGTAARNLEALAPLLRSPYAARCLFGTDDKHPESLLGDGHMDYVVRKAISLGVDPICALKVASFNAAQAFGLSGQGAIAPGYAANLAVLDGDERAVSVRMTLKNGNLVYHSDSAAPFTVPAPAISPALREKALHTFQMDPVTPSHFALQKPAGLLQMLPGQIVTENGGMAEGVDVAEDILKIAVLERHHHTGHIGVGYLKGYGLSGGAIATSIAHDSHNLIVVGATDQDMAVAADRVRALGGGIVLASQGRVVDELSLPIAGLMSDAPLPQVNDALERLKSKAVELGVSPGVDPFMTLSFMSLPVIPSLRVLTKGVFDVNNWQYLT